MNSRKLFVMIMVMLMTFGAYDVLAGGCGSSCGGCAGCGDETETDLSVFGSYRYRFNTEGFDFSSDTPLSWFTESRARVGLKARANDKAGAFFQMQDCRIIGSNAGWAFNTIDLQTHQAYLWYKPCDKGWVKAGIMEVTFHNGRLVSAVPWDNTGRTFEGLMFGRSFNENASITAFAFQIDELFDSNPSVDWDPAGTDPWQNDPQADPMFYGLNLNLAEQNVDFFVYLVKMPVVGGGAFTDDISFMTFGAYTNREITTDVWFDGMFAMQSGTHDMGEDLSGMMFNGKVAKKFSSGLKIAAGVDYTTGDDPATTDEYEDFNNLFMDYHRYWGAMDMNLNPMGMDAGLMDLFVMGKYPINSLWTAGGVFHKFATVEDIDGAFTGSGNAETSIGTEVDFFVVYKAPDFAWKTGYSMFSRNKDMYGGDPDSQGWWSSSATVYW